MIRAICLNPAIDRTYYIDGYVPGRPYRQIQPKVMSAGRVSTRQRSARSWVSLWPVTALSAAKTEKKCCGR